MMQSTKCRAARSLFLFATLMLGPMLAQGAEHYVRAGGTGNGTDWANALGQLPATLVRGDTYWVAAGTYPGYSFTTPAEGDKTITVKKATAGAHGSAAGWQPAYGEGAAVWGPMSCSAPYVVFDGVTGSGKSGHGFEINGGKGGAELWGFENAPGNVTISHVNMHFDSRDVAPTDAIYGNTPCKEITVSNCYIHDISRCPLLMRHWTKLVWENNWAARNKSTAESHAEGVSTHGGEGHIFRNSVWEDIEGTAIIVNLDAPTRNWEIYGNVFFETGKAGGIGHGIVGDNFANSAVEGLKFYNNSAYNLTGVSTGLRFWAAGSTGIVVQNNVWVKCQSVGFNQAAHDFNAYYDCPTSFEFASGAGGNELRTSGDPFAGAASGDFHIKAATAPGAKLAAPFDVDPDKKARGSDGAWDRGAYEFGGTAAPDQAGKPQTAATAGTTSATTATAGTAPQKPADAGTAVAGNGTATGVATTPPHGAPGGGTEPAGGVVDTAAATPVAIPPSPYLIPVGPATAPAAPANGGHTGTAQTTNPQPASGAETSAAQGATDAAAQTAAGGTGASAEAAPGGDAKAGGGAETGTIARASKGKGGSSSSSAPSPAGTAAGHGSKGGAVSGSHLSIAFASPAKGSLLPALPQTPNETPVSTATPAPAVLFEANPSVTPVASAAPLTSSSEAGLPTAAVAETVLTTASAAASVATTTTAVAVAEIKDEATSGGLVAAYGFEHNDGILVRDLSAQGNNGQSEGAAWTSAGKFGGGMFFDGTRSRISVKDAPSLALSGGMTLEAWVCPIMVNGWRNVLTKEQSLGADYYLYANTQYDKPGTSIHSENEVLQVGGTKPAVGQWTHLAATYDGQAQRLYINGKEVAARVQTGPIKHSGGPLRIGGNAVWGEHFMGRIDEVRIYSRALTAEEIAKDMETPVYMTMGK